MPRHSKDRSLSPSSSQVRIRHGSTKESHQNPASYIDRGSEASRYEPLDPAGDEVRLLRIKPSLKSGLVDCHLFHTHLSSAPPYTALSYAWGGRSKLQKILLDSSPVSVTHNLKKALQRLRPKDGEDLIIWVDALCINQADVSERNGQIGKMRSIYQNAESVSVWLGSNYQGSQLAMSLARDLNHRSKLEIPSAIRDPLNAEAFNALVALFRRQYWWRAWVIQEVTYAKNCTVYCGRDAISWTELENVCDILKEHEDLLQDIYYSRLSYIRTLTYGGPKSLLLSRSSPTASAPPLLELLVSHKSKKSTDPKDKVYALVGISNSQNTFGPFDYSLSMRDVFSHTARHIITTTRKLDVICVRQHNVNQFGLPSWVPDWTRPPFSEGHIMIGLQHREPAFSAGGDTLAGATFLGGGYVLKTSGLIIGNIIAVGTPFERQGPADVVPVLHAFDDWWTAFVKYKGNSTSSKVSFARCISCENWGSDSNKDYMEKLQMIFDFSSSGRAESDSAYDELQQGGEGLKRKRAGTPEEEKSQVATVLSASLMMNKRTLFISESTAGLAPCDAKPGDLVCVLPGCRFPAVLRKQEDHFILIGEAYVDGFMHGEAMDGLRDERFELETFELY